MQNWIIDINHLVLVVIQSWNIYRVLRRNVIWKSVSDEELWILQVLRHGPFTAVRHVRLISSGIIPVDSHQGNHSDLFFWSVIYSAMSNSGVGDLGLVEPLFHEQYSVSKL